MASPADYYQHQQPQHQRQQHLHQNHQPFQQPQPPQHQYNLPPAPPQHQDRAPRTIPEEQVSYGHQYQEPPSPSKRRTFSFHSDKSQPRKGPVVKTDLHETHAEKEAKRLHSKADPTLAMNEAEPSAVATMKTEIIVTPLRSLQHKDALGNVIAEPDKSNPTRHRWERPLDTIRSFEAAIDGGYSRKSMYRADTESVMLNRRSSYHPGQQSRHDSYYGSRPVSIRPEYTHQGRNSYYEGQGFNGGYGPPPGRQHRASRQYSEPQFHSNGRDSAVYPLPHKDRSYETVTSAAASGHSDAAGYHTDPTSSDNSSIERVAPSKRQEPMNDYGIGFNQSPSYNAPNLSMGVPRQGNPLPPIPQDAAHGNTAPVQRKMVKRQPSGAQAQAATPNADKRKSWFSRRFSKSS